MLAALLATAVVPHLQTKTIELYKGATVVGQDGATFRYWDVEDTYLDPKNPDRNFGGHGKISGGTGRTILIRFGDLNRAIGPMRRVKRAALHLTYHQQAT